MSNDLFDQLYNGEDVRDLEVLRQVRAVVRAVEHDAGQSDSRIFEAAEEKLDCTLRVHAFPPVDPSGAPPAQLGRMYYGQAADMYNEFRHCSPAEGGRMHGHTDQKV